MRMILAIDGGEAAVKEPFPVWPSFDEAVYECVLAPLRTGKVNYWTGDVGRRFERALADYCGARYAITTTNGTSALHTALSVLGVGAGDEVICPSYTFIATAFAVLQAGALPVFADVDETHTLDPARLEALITERTRAIIVVHVFGVIVDMDPVLDVAARHNLLVIEDCAQALGGVYRGKKLGTLGHAGCFSFCQSKHFTTGGEGGAVILNDEDAAWACRSFRDHGYDVAKRMELLELEGRLNYVHPRAGYNYRMTEMQSAIGLVELARFEAWNLCNRRRNGRYLTENLSGHPVVLSVPLDTETRQNAFWVAPFVLDIDALRVPIRRIADAMVAEGVPVSPTPWPEIYREAAFLEQRGFGRRNYPFRDPGASPISYDDVVCETARRLGERTLVFPMHPVYEQRHMDQYLEVFAKVVEYYRR
jgi:dTDP-4-amino-4,6-dideoxygalactose transaminase